MVEATVVLAVWRKLFPRDTVPFCSPFTEVNLLAAMGAEWTIG